MSNPLARDVGLKVGPIIFETLVKHYFDKHKKDGKTSGQAQELKDVELLYHEAFTIIKSFMNASTHHTVEELQSFSNTRTPSSPWMHVVRTLVPMSSCEEAAGYLIIALGGEDAARSIVGGVKWWQVRGVNGVDAQWMTAKKDWEELKRKHKARERSAKEDAEPTRAASDGGEAPPEGTYDKNMDAMRCILYLHGGGYYFGSVDQERYSIQRHARKINGRVFAINYRLAPQYPFPCALQDALAAYLFLIRPPAGAEHQAVDPGHIVVAGDSAGGGLSLALLQTIRDSGLPQPAGAVLISPWCDLMHSFPSIVENTKTDIIPDTGLSFHKPSTLWPPPAPELLKEVHTDLRTKIRETLRPGSDHAVPPPTSDSETSSDERTSSSTSSRRKASNAERLASVDQTPPEIKQQVHFYTVNGLLRHPLVSPALSYLGGLPPLLFIAGDKEVLRDEVIYTAHRAAYPEKFKIEDDVRELYPKFKDLDPSTYKPTSVHLQVYDDTPHVLPVLFSFTTPAKFCFRAIATFTKFVTKVPPSPTPTALPKSKSAVGGLQGSALKPLSRRHSMLAGFMSIPAKLNQSEDSDGKMPDGRILDDTVSSSPRPLDSLSPSPHTSITRSLSQRFAFSRGQSFIGRRPQSTISESPTSPVFAEALKERLQPLALAEKDEMREEADVKTPQDGDMGKSAEVVKVEAENLAKVDVANGSTGGREDPRKTQSSDVGGARFKVHSLASMPKAATGDYQRTAGEAAVYEDIQDCQSWSCSMIRERVSTQGVVRDLEPEEKLSAFSIPHENIARFFGPTLARYHSDDKLFRNRFAHTHKTIAKHRDRNLKRAKKDTIRRLGALQRLLHHSDAHKVPSVKVKEQMLSSPDWGWAWALDEEENPPPSSIVARRDTDEARQLAEIADKAVFSEDDSYSANNLWSVVVNFLTTTPGKSNFHLGHTAGTSKTGASSWRPWRTSKEGSEEKEMEGTADKQSDEAKVGPQDSVSRGEELQPGALTEDEQTKSVKEKGKLSRFFSYKP